MQTIGLRYAIIYGPREWYGRVLTIFLKRALNGKAPVVFGDGKQLRDFTYVDDLVDLHTRCLTRNTGLHEIFNVSTGVGTSIRKLAQTVLKVTGIGGKPVFEEIAEGERSALVDEKRERLPCELQRMVLDPSKAKRKLRWEPKITLAEGLRREYEWLSQNPGRWKKMSY
jgi:UDP-glucose 4-epimerase